jgi:heat shock protein HslJ
MNRARLWVLPILLLAAGCQTAGTGAGTPESAAVIPLTEITWNVVSIDGEPVAPSRSGRKAHIKFDAAAKRAAGFNGCNNFFGGYTLDSERLSFGMMGSTMMACTEDPDIERRMMEALGAIDRYHRDGDTLTLFQGAKKRMVLHIDSGE